MTYEIECGKKSEIVSDYEVQTESGNWKTPGVKCDAFKIGFTKEGYNKRTWFYALNCDVIIREAETGRRIHTYHAISN